MNRACQFALLVAWLLPASAAPAAALPLAEVKTAAGVPQLFIHGQPHSGFSYATDFPPVPREIQDFARAGIHFFQFYANVGDFWKGPARYDFTAVDAGYGALLQADPQAVAAIRLGLNAPRWWIDTHPAELATADVGMIVGQQSLVSSVWRDEAGAALAALVRHIAASTYGDHVVGYFTWAGEEWTYPGCWWPDYTPYDYSAPMQRAFRAWLAARYRHDAAALRKAWHDDAVTFATAQVPSRARRLQRDFLGLRDPAAGRPAIDYEMAAAEGLVDSIAHFARVTKEASQRRVITGAFYGYVIDCSMHFHNYGQQLMGHAALGRLLDCSDFDVLANPAQYRHRGPGEGWASQTLIDSVRLHGKLFMSEDDVRTPLAGDRCGQANDAAANEAVLERTLGWRLTENTTGWFLSFSRQPEWYGMPVLMAQLARLNSLAESLRPWTGPPTAEVAVFVDPTSYLYLSPSLCDATATVGQAYDAKRTPAAFSSPGALEVFSKAVSRQVSEELIHLGAPFHLYLLDDLARPNLPDYKLYVFLNAVHFTPTQRQAVAQRVKRDHRTALWLYSAGFASDDELSANAMGELTGFRFRVNPFRTDTLGNAGGAETPVTLRITDRAHPLTRGFTESVLFRSDQPIGPMFAVADPAARVLGELTADYYPFPRAAGLAVKEFPSWNSIFCAAPVVPAAFLRQAARYAGAHLDNDQGDVIYASATLLALHTAFTGRHQLDLPGPTALFSVTEGQWLGGRRTALTLDLPAGTTRLYLLGAAARWARTAHLPPAIIQGGHIPLAGPLLDRTMGSFLPGWRWENLTATKSNHGDWSCQLTPTNQPALLRCETPLDWGQYAGLEIQWQAPEAPVAKFQLTDGAGDFYFWNLPAGGNPQRAVLDLRGLAAGLTQTAALQLNAAATIGPIHLLTRLPPGVRPIPPRKRNGLALRDWLYLGPFDDSQRAGVDLGLPPDHELKLDANYPGKNGPIRWQPLRIEGKLIEMPRDVQFAIGYFLTHVYAPKDTRAVLLVGSDDGVKVWLNGRQVWRHQVARACRVGEDRIPVELPAGWNQLLFKVNQFSEGWGLSAILDSADDQPLLDLANKATP